MGAQAVILGAALLQWVVFVAIGFFKRTRALIPSTLLMAAAYGWVFHAGSLLPKSRSPIAAASAVGGGASASCALIEPGMTAAAVREKIGQPPEVRDAAKTRGPGAETWVYPDSRCAVHLFDGRVELVD